MQTIFGLMKRLWLFLFLTISFLIKANAQEPLPDFSADDMGNNKTRISWINNFGDSCIQLMVQTSYDSIRGFKTIFSTESPQLPQNGFVYSPTYPAKLYFRVFYILIGNTYYFTKAKKPAIAVYNPMVDENINKNIVAKNESQEQPKPEPVRIITIKTKDSIIAKIVYNEYSKFRDSIAKQTKDTLFILSQDIVLLKPFNPENYYKPSTYVVTNKDGFVTIKLPDANKKNYKIVFMTMQNEKLFTINHIEDTEVVVDKTNFIHAGWFKFELYEDNKLKEKNKILLQRDF